MFITWRDSPLGHAVARGLKDPSFRVIQNRFAVLGNLGDVVAKEEVGEVFAQLIGLGLGILVLVSSSSINMDDSATSAPLATLSASFSSSV